MKLQTLKKKKLFSSFFQKSFQNSSESFEKKKYKKALLNENTGEIEKSIFFNYSFDKGRLKNIVCWFFEKHGQYKTLKFLEKLKEIGFGAATSAGISLGIDDLKIPKKKITLVSTAETKVAKDLLYYRNAKITGIERIQRLIYTWNQTNDTLKQEVVKFFETTDIFNPIYMMAFSGARGNMSQVRQLVGMRGLMSDPQGQIIDFPIQSNFREGLTLTEYLISTYGARKGIVDTALRTATAGYLTRRLVDVAQHTIVSKFDCGTMRGIFLFDMKDGKKTIYSFQNRLIGRVLAQNIEFFDQTIQNFENEHISKKKQIAFRNQEIDSKLAQILSKVTKKAFVRSPLTCETSRFVCQLCYGWSFSHGKLVSVGDAVGIIAAQSIGEPGTQLTMRTFHTGGVFAGGLTDQILAPFDGKIQYFQNIPGICVRNTLSEIAFFTKMPGSFFVKKVYRTPIPNPNPSPSPSPSPFGEGRENSSQFNEQHNEKSKKKRGEIFRIPAYAILFCRNNEFVRKKQVLAQFSSILKKMQYGRAEQTLYSTLAGEFVFGKSFLPPRQIKKKFKQELFSSSQLGNNQKSKILHSNDFVSTQRKISKNLHIVGEQSLLLEKRTGDFSEVELQNDMLWKSQNWTTVWILSGNVFSNSLNTHFSFREGDFFKKTSVLKKILWAKKKRYKYFLFSNSQIQKKTQQNVQYLFAQEKKKTYNFLSPFTIKNFQYSSLLLKTPTLVNLQKKKKLENFMNPFFSGSTCGIQVNTVFKGILFHKSQTHKIFGHFFQSHIQTNFSISYFSFFLKNHFFKAKKVFSLYTSLFFQKPTNFISSNISFHFEKQNTDFVFFQNKSNRFFTDFEKINLHFPNNTFEKVKTLYFSAQAVKKKTFLKEELENHLFFKFLNKRKQRGYPLFLNISTFSKVFEMSQKFQFVSFLSYFSNMSLQKNFLHTPSGIGAASPPAIPSCISSPSSSPFWEREGGKTVLSARGAQLQRNHFLLQKQKSVFQYSFFKKKNFNSHSFFSFFDFSKEKKKIVLLRKRKISKTPFFFNKLICNKINSFKKNKKHFDSNKKIENIVFKKFLLELPLEKIYYKKFGYFSSFSTFLKNKKLKNSFQIFSTLTENENFQNAQRNSGKKENVFPISMGECSKEFNNENFFGKNSPISFSYSFCESSHINTGGIFYFSFFEDISRKEKFSYFLCENFFDSENKKVFFLKPKFLEKTERENKNSFSFFAEQSSFLSIQNIKNLYLYVDNIFQFSNFEKDLSKKSKKIMFSSTNEHFIIFQIPTFSFLSFSTNSFFKSFLNQNDKFFSRTPIPFGEEEDSKKAFSIFEKTNFVPLFHLSEYGNGNKLSQNKNKFLFFPTSPLFGKMNHFLNKKFILNIGDTSVDFLKDKISYIVLPVHPLFFQKQINKAENFYPKNKKRKMNNFSPHFLEKKFGKLKEKPFFFFHFGFNKKLENSYRLSGENKKQKNFLSDSQRVIDFYEKDIFWLPKENFLTFTSKIDKKKLSTISFCYLNSCFDLKPILFFVNNQGKKKSFSFDAFKRNEANKEFPKQKKIQGLLKISNCQIFQRSNFPFTTEKKQDCSFISQKISFFSNSKQEKTFFSKNRKNNFQKNIAFKFHKRIQNKQFQNIQKIFSKKVDEFEKQSKKYFKNQSFFGKKLRSQCFTCLPFQKKMQNSLNSLRKQQKFKNYLQTTKLRFEVEPGWLVFPLSCHSLSFLGNHKKIKKKGQFFQTNISFEQNDTFFETVFHNSQQSFPFLSLTKDIHENGFISTSNVFQKSLFFIQENKKKSFHIGFLQTNKNCRYISFENSSLKFEIKDQGNNENILYSFSPSFNKKRNVNFEFLFHQCVSPFSPILTIQSQFSKSQKKKKIRKRNFMYFYRPFQYKIVENSQNFKKFFQNIRVQNFSNFLSFSYFQLYKKYHSVFLNHQKKQNKFYHNPLLGGEEKRKNSDFQIMSNFQNMYLPDSHSPFISFTKSSIQLYFKTQFLKKFKSKQFQQEKNEKFKKKVFFLKFLFARGKKVNFSSNLNLQTSQNQVLEIFSKENGRKNFFFHFSKVKKKKNCFSFYPIQFLPLVLSLSFSSLKKTNSAFFSKNTIHSSFPIFSMNSFQNRIQFQLCEKRATFFDERFSFGNFSDFVETSSFWLNKDSMNFLFSPFAKTKKLKNLFLNSKNKSLLSISKKKNVNFIQNFVFKKNIHFYGSTEFMSPYEGELLPLFTHDLHWWKKASEISTLQKFEKLFIIVTKKDFLSVQYPFDTKDSKENKKLFLFDQTQKGNNNCILKEKQKSLKKLYHVLSLSLPGLCLDREKNFQTFTNQFENNLNKKEKILSFITKYEKKIYTFQNLTIGYPSLLKKPLLGSFVVYGDNFFGSALQKPGQIIHFGLSSMTIRRGQPCLVSSNGLLHFSNIPYIKKNVPLVTLPYQTLQAGDIVQGIPKVEQFFEARTTLQGRLFVSSIPILLKGIFERYKVLLPLEQAVRQSFLKIQQIIVDGVQRVYRSQGVSITDKHLEVVVRQMTTKVQILHGAQTGFFPGELVNLDLVERINKFLMVKIRYEPVILGITRASLEVDSFLSASSFQQTTKILSLAAISRKKDFLKGLKENLLVGNLIPSGTGYFNLSPPRQ